MLTKGRLKRIKSYISPTNGTPSAGILLKFCCELVEEVERLRLVCRNVAESFEPEGDEQLTRDERKSVQACREALEETNLGPPDMI